MGVNIIDFPSPLKLCKLCLMVEAEVITMSDVALNVFTRNI